jgi:hypothetical protein
MPLREKNRKKKRKNEREISTATASIAFFCLLRTCKQKELRFYLMEERKEWQRMGTTLKKKNSNIRG